MAYIIPANPLDQDQGTYDLWRGSFYSWHHVDQLQFASAAQDHTCGCCRRRNNTLTSVVAVLCFVSCVVMFGVRGGYLLNIMFVVGGFACWHVCCYVWCSRVVMFVGLGFVFLSALYFNTLPFL